MDLLNKIVIITGASQGIGKAAAYKFVEAGSKVVLIARSENMLNDIVSDIGNEKSFAIPADISQLEGHTQIIDQTIDVFGQIDILVNNAGVGIYNPCETVRLSDLKAVMDLNFWGAFHLTQACIPKMKSQGGGLIINISSIAGRRSVPNMGGYSASKAALELITEAWRMELINDNIRFSTLYPGTTQTNFKSSALGTIQQKSSPTERMPAEMVAKKLVQVAKQEPRDAYARFFDKAFVFSSRLFPGLFDKLLSKYYK
jgi:short-subunit dehydrogenase